MPESRITKVCSHCKQEKPATLDEFYASKNKKGLGLCTRCKICHNIYAKEYYFAHRETCLENNRAYAKRPENRARENARRNHRYHKDPVFRAKQLEKNKRYHARPEVKERINAYRRNRYKTEPAFRAYQLSYAKRRSKK
jgi:hypothetical protein